MMLRTIYLALLCAVTGAYLTGCPGKPAAVASRSASAGNVGFYIGLPTEAEKEAVKTFVLSLTPEQVRKANAYTQANPEGLRRTGRGQGLPDADLTQEQKQALAALWTTFQQRDQEFAEAHPKYAARRALPGPLEQSEIFNVGYYYIPEETKDNTLLSFESKRWPLGTAFETTVPEVLELPAALRTEALNLAEWGCRIAKHVPPEMEPRLRKAEDKATARRVISRSLTGAP